jgi:hypothetical protein
MCDTYFWYIKFISSGHQESQLTITMSRVQIQESKVSCRGQGEYSSVQHLPSMDEALGLISPLPPKIAAVYYIQILQCFQVTR